MVRMMNSNLYHTHSPQNKVFQCKVMETIFKTCPMKGMNLNISED